MLPATATSTLELNEVMIQFVMEFYGLQDVFSLVIVSSGRICLVIH